MSDYSPDSPEALEQRVWRLEVKNGNLLESLWEQWSYNHSEHCDVDWPHPEGVRCHWPLPEPLRDQIKADP